MPLKRIYLSFLCLILLSSFAVVYQNDKPNPIALINDQTDYEVGSTIVLKFSFSKGEKPLLYCSNSYGSTLVNATLNNKTLQYTIPENMTKKRWCC